MQAYSKPQIQVECRVGDKLAWEQDLARVDSDLETRYLRCQQAELPFSLSVPDKGTVRSLRSALGRKQGTGGVDDSGLGTRYLCCRQAVLSFSLSVFNKGTVRPHAHMRKTHSATHRAAPCGWHLDVHSDHISFTDGPRLPCMGTYDKQMHVVLSALHCYARSGSESI